MGYLGASPKRVRCGSGSFNGTVPSFSAGADDYGSSERRKAQLTRSVLAFQVEIHNRLRGLAIQMPELYLALSAVCEVDLLYGPTNEFT